MNFYFGILFVLVSHSLFSQENVKRLPNEKMEIMVQRYIDEINSLNDSIEESDYNDWEILHSPVEIEFGYFEGKRIVVILKSKNDNYLMNVGLFTPEDKNSYRFETFGEFSYGMYNGDSILSVFSYDSNNDDLKELMILGRGNVRTIDESGLDGCCITIYETTIFSESTAEYDVFRSEESKAYLSGLKNAGEVKAAINRFHMSQELIYKGTKEDFVKAHLKKMDSLDRKSGIIGDRIIIDKIYEMSFGELNRKHFVVSFVRKIDEIEKYYTGVFEKNEDGNYSYIESNGIKLVEYIEYKDYKMESIFTYDADKDLPKENELVILLSAKNLNNSDEKEFKAFVGMIAYDHSMVYLQEGWKFGVTEEKSAAEIKIAIETFHKNK